MTTWWSTNLLRRNAIKNIKICWTVVLDLLRKPIRLLCKHWTWLATIRIQIKSPVFPIAFMASRLEVTEFLRTLPTATKDVELQRNKFFRFGFVSFFRLLRLVL